MRKTSRMILSTLLCGFIMTTFALAERDPKKGAATYVGSAITERPAEFAEVYFTFTVDYRDSDADVITAIQAAAKNAWDTIVREAPATATETDASLWQEIVTNAPKDGDGLETRDKPKTKGAKKPNESNPVTQIVVRTDARTGKDQESLEGIAPQIFSGTQTFGVRLSDLNRLEAVVAAVKTITPAKSRNAVKIVVGKIDYKVTEATRRSINAELIERAKTIAIGSGSKYAIDDRHFPLATVYITGRGQGQDSSYADKTTTELPTAPGGAHRVRLTIPFYYTVYAEGKDLKGGFTTEPVNNSYQVTESAARDADFLETSVTVSTMWLAGDKNLPEQAVGVHAKILAGLSALIVKRDAFNELNDDEPTDPREWQSVKEVEWNSDDKATKYYDRVSGKLESPKVPGNEDLLPKYYLGSKTFKIRTNRFREFAALVEKLRREYGVSGAGSNPKITVTVGSVKAKVTEDHALALALEAREKAAAGVMSVEGELASDVFAQGLTAVHLLSFAEGEPVVAEQKALRRRNLDAVEIESLAFSAAAAGGGGAEEVGLKLKVIEKPGDSRKWVRSERQVVQFTVQFKTQPLEQCPAWLAKANHGIPVVKKVPAT